MDERTNKHRLGLQRRIMIYAAVGLGLLFVAWGVISRTSIDRVSELLLEERLATAQSVAAAFANELHHMRNDLGEDMELFSATAARAETGRTAEDSFTHLATVDEFTYFEVDGLVLIREDGTISATSPASFTETHALRIVPGGVWPLDPCATAVTENGKVAIIRQSPDYRSCGGCSSRRIGHCQRHQFDRPTRWIPATGEI